MLQSLIYTGKALLNMKHFSTGNVNDVQCGEKVQARSQMQRLLSRLERGDPRELPK